MIALNKSSCKRIADV